MSLFVPHQASAFDAYDNWGTNPSATPGTGVIAGTGNALGSWVQIASSANISFDVYGFYVQFVGGSTSGASKQHLADIGIDPAGGTSYTSIISDFCCGSAPGATQAGSREHFFPLRIPAGSSVAARIRGSHATGSTVRMPFKFYGGLSAPGMFRSGSFSETLGADQANSKGTAFTPGNAADGAWALLGTTVNDLWWWQLGHQIDNTTITSEYTYIELAYGDASNKTSIFRMMHGGTTVETAGFALQTQLVPLAAYCPVKAGTNIYIRGRCNNAPDSGYNANVVGIGG